MKNKNFLDELIHLLDNAIDKDADNSAMWWNIIARGYRKDIDSYKHTLQQWHTWINDYSEKIIQDSWIKNLRIKYTTNNWYFIEISKNQEKNIPVEFIHKQTLVSALRYTTMELQQFQIELDKANSELNQLEYDCFIEIRNTVNNHFSNLYSLSRKIEQLDFYSNAAYVSQKFSYITPEILSSKNLEIHWWRHPVMEQTMTDFISNELALNSKDYVHVITGPNMWWKSTFLRQNALLILMSHIWFDIPAKRAKIPITDRIFSRVWSADNLFLWQSTFMVEMQEIAFILHNATDKSFVIIDEIWRWTSTYDGMSLAWAILKKNHDTIKAKTLFATHYHEIIDFSQKLAWCQNYSVAVWENDNNIVFLRKIIPWWIKKSYWIEVARLAWIPSDVLECANDIMMELSGTWNYKQLAIYPPQTSEKEVSNEIQEWIQNISNINLNETTPLKAFQYLQEFQEQVKKTK